jgi:hypothetical protein
MTQYHESQTINITSFTLNVDANINFIALLGLNRPRIEASYNETIIKNKKEKEKNVGKDNFLLSVNIVVLPPAC